MKLRILSWIVLSFAYTAACASTTVDFDTIFVAPATDMSLYYLGILFGSVNDVLIGGSNAVVGQMFYVFNTGIITFTALLIFYTLTLSVVNTAQDGNAMGQKVSTWIVLRIVTGMSLLVPSYSGYSAIQVLVMWSVVQGVGFADTIWTQALDTIQAYGGSVVIPVYQGLESSGSSGGPRGAPHAASPRPPCRRPAGRPERRRTPTCRSCAGTQSGPRPRHSRRRSRWAAPGPPAAARWR